MMMSIELRRVMSTAAEIPLEVVILLIAGMAVLIAGVVMVPVARGALPYYEQGWHGLLLIVIALQVITLGKTPFGDRRRSRLLLAVGVALASAGMVACFIPIATPVPRLLLAVCLGPGHAVLLLKMIRARDKLRAWLRPGALFRRLMLAGSLVYGLGMLVALPMWDPDLIGWPVSAFILLVFGASILYLANVLRAIDRANPQAPRPPAGDVRLSAAQGLLLLMGVFMVLLGGLLVPVNLGLLPFSGSAQLGLLMVIFAVQMLASGNTPIGTVRRCRLSVVVGVVFAALGIVSCLVPGILVATLTRLVGGLNMLGGAIGLAKLCRAGLARSAGTEHRTPAILRRLAAVQAVLNLLAIAFGAAMLMANLIPGLLVGLILAANGGVLLYLLRLLVLLDGMAPPAACPAG